MARRLISLGMAACLLLWAGAALAGEAKEIRTYQGAELSPFHRQYDNSIAGPQKVDPKTLRLVVKGLVDKPLSLTYEQVLALKPVERMAPMNCVEGWREDLLFKGVRVADLLAEAGAKKNATWVIFRAADGYSSAMPVDYLIKSNALLAFQVNGLTLDEARGFPFWLVAEGKLGYKWVKWVLSLELTDKEYKGYWEKRGYGNQADVKRQAPRLKE